MISEFNQKELRRFKALMANLIVTEDTIVQLSDYSFIFKCKNIVTGEIFCFICQYGQKISLNTSEFHNLRRYCDIYAENFI